MADYEIFELEAVSLQSGLTLRPAKLAYKTYGQLNAARDNVIVMPTFYGGQHAENEALMAAWPSLDPQQYFIIVPNMFGNGLSSSPSNTPPPFDRAVFPNITLYDNVLCQHRLVTEHLGITAGQTCGRVLDGGTASVSVGCLVPGHGPGHRPDLWLGAYFAAQLFIS